jgi:hypothetical protein
MELGIIIIIIIIIILHSGFSINVRITAIFITEITICGKGDK